MVEYFQQAVIRSNVPDEVKDHLMVGLQECRLEEAPMAFNTPGTNRLLHGIVQVGTRSYHLHVDLVELRVVHCEVR